MTTGSQEEIEYDLNNDPEVDIVLMEDVDAPVWQVSKLCGPWSSMTGSLVSEEEDFVVISVREKGEQYNLRLPRGLCRLVNVAEKEHELAQTKRDR